MSSAVIDDDDGLVKHAWGQCSGWWPTGTAPVFPSPPPGSSWTKWWLSTSVGSVHVQAYFRTFGCSGGFNSQLLICFNKNLGTISTCLSSAVTWSLLKDSCCLRESAFFVCFIKFSLVSFQDDPVIHWLNWFCPEAAYNQNSCQNQCSFFTFIEIRNSLS